MREPFGELTRNHIIRKYIAKFHPEEHATLVVSQRKLVLGDMGIWCTL